MSDTPARCGHRRTLALAAAPRVDDPNKAQEIHQSMPASCSQSAAGEKRKRSVAFRPLKRACPGTVKDAVKRLYDQAGGVPRVMLVLSKGKSQVYAYADEQSEHQLTLAQAAALTTAAAPALAEFFAALADGVFLPLAIDGGLSELHALTAEAARESGETIAGMIAALADGRVDQREAREGIQHIDDTVRTLAALRSLLLARLEGEEGR